MAKKKNKAAASASDAAPEAAPAKAATKSDTKADAKADAPVDVAYRAGNFSAVRQLAASGDAHATALAQRVKVDPQQILIGAITLFVVAFAAFLTLR